MERTTVLEHLGSPLVWNAAMHRYRIFLIIGLLVAFSLCAACVVWSTGETAFDSAEWKSARGRNGSSNPRKSMVHDLQGAYLNKGLSREKVIILLGEPDSESKQEICYELGLTGFFPVDGSTLVIKLDDQGLLTSTRVISH